MGKRLSSESCSVFFGGRIKGEANSRGGGKKKKKKSNHLLREEETSAEKKVGILPRVSPSRAKL